MHEGLSEGKLSLVSPALRKVVEQARARVMQPVTNNSYDTMVAFKLMKARSMRKKRYNGATHALAEV